MDFNVEKIKSSVGKEYIRSNHYTGSCHNGPMCWGLKSNDKLLGVIAFATPISENVRASIFGPEYKNHVTELHRMVIDDDCPHNTGSYFISRALSGLKGYKPKYYVVISFADQTEGHDGTVYQAANFLYYGTTGSRTIFYRDEEGNLRAPRQNGVNITEDMARERGWEPELREAKHRYLYLLPDGQKHREKLLNQLEVEVQGYP